MERELELTKLSGGCDDGPCPAGHLSNRGTFVFQGPAVISAKGLQLGEGEHAVELAEEIVREALRAFDSR